jgi:putative endonuclease
MTRLTGAAGEDRAVRYLEGEGYRILERNFRTPRGEIDIVAQNGERVVFVEVKNWQAFGAEDLEHSIDRRKRSRIRRASQEFLLQHPELRERRIGYDVVLFSSASGPPRHYQNAFNGIL